MGYVYNALVAPAVLFLNPGITREELVRLLDQTHSSLFYEYKPEDAWNYHTEKTDDDVYHGGLKGLAHILALRDTGKFKKFKKHKWDEYGLLINSPFLTHDGRNDEGYEIVIHERNVLEEPRAESSYSWNQLKVGSVWECPMGSSNRGIVLEINKESIVKAPKDDEDEPAAPEFYYNMVIRPFHGEYRAERFEREEDFYRKWPQFHVDFARDWKQERGFFSRTAGKGFFWRMDKGKYYFDEATFNEIPAVKSVLEYGYTDFMLTVEAVKHGAWKVLSYRGLQHFPQFLRDFPDVIPVYERAVWDSHTSLYARSQGMNTFDFLRFRLLKGL